MTREQLDALKAYIDARIDEKIEDAFGRDALHEYLARSSAETELDASVVIHGESE
jgi:hypothetical protein